MSPPTPRRLGSPVAAEAVDSARCASNASEAVLDGFRRRLGRPTKRSWEEKSTEELAADAAELSSALGAAPIEEARMAAIERLTELRAAGSISEEDYTRKKRRLSSYG